MLFRVDTSSSVPVYAQIVAQAKNAVAAGVLRPGDRLPSLRDTARVLRINPNTVVKAYRELEVQGVVRTEHGRGSVVTSSAAPVGAAERAQRLDRLAEQLAVEAYHLGAAPDEASAALQRALEGLQPAFASRDLEREHQELTDAVARHTDREENRA